MSTTKPSPTTGGWLPPNPADRRKWLEDLVKGVENDQRARKPPTDGGFSAPQPPYKHESVQKLGAFIEDNVQLSLLFRYMLEEVPFSHRFDTAGKPYNVVTLEQLLQVFDKIIDTPPGFSPNVGVALPFSLVLEWPMATTAGIAGFLDKGLNGKLKDVLNDWGAYLADPNRDSKRVLGKDDPDGWLSTDARNIMQRRDPKHRTFEQMYACDPEDDYLGFKTWNDFFIRGFKDKTIRPIEDPDDDSKIASACESVPLTIRQKVKEEEKFWIKGQPYSLKHMLDSVQDAKKFVGGTVYQAYLASLNYHRWHSPINGIVTKIRLIAGTYFAISPTNTFPDPETLAGAQSQQYSASVATRAIFHINNPTVGDMVVMPIGLVEISTCEINKDLLAKMKEVEDESKAADKESLSRTWVPKYGTTVALSKGDELGTFRCGGSTHVLIFGKDVEVKFWPRAIPIDTEEDYLIPVNATIADVKSKNDVKSIYDF